MNKYVKNLESTMKRLLAIAAAGLALLLAGCATTIRSDVTTFQQWPAQMLDKTYGFEVPAPQEDTLEWRSYQELVRAQLARLGFHDSGAARPAVTVAMHFTTTDVPLRVIQAADPYFYPPMRIGWGGPRHRRYWGGWYSPFHDPFWGSPFAYEERIVHQYQRELHVTIRSSKDGKQLFDVTVHNSSGERSTPAVMPALVQSAFQDFPGPNGAARVVELQRKDG
jgi:hypothetical protein